MKTIIFGSESYTDYYESGESYQEAFDRAIEESGEHLVCVICTADGIDMDLPENQEDAKELMVELDRTYN